MSAILIAPGLWRVGGWPPWLINCYLVEGPDGDILIDAGTRWVTGTLLRQLRDRRLQVVALTHVHPDHQGAARDVCERFKVPLVCHTLDADVMEGKARMGPPNPWIRVFSRLLSGPPCPVARRLQEGDRVGELTVVHTPGHTPGHVVYHRERDGLVIIGDVVRHASVRFGFGRLSEPPHFFSTDPMENRRSMRKLLDLKPSLCVFGHGPPLRDMGLLEQVVGRMPIR